MKNKKRNGNIDMDIRKRFWFAWGAGDLFPSVLISTLPPESPDHQISPPGPVGFEEKYSWKGHSQGSGRQGFSPSYLCGGGPILLGWSVPCLGVRFVRSFVCTFVCSSFLISGWVKCPLPSSHCCSGIEGNKSMTRYPSREGIRRWDYSGMKEEGTFLATVNIPVKNIGGGREG